MSIKINILFRSKIVEIPADEVVRYTLLYPNDPHDIETLIVDPLSDDIYLVQKNWFGTTAAIYKVNVKYILMNQIPIYSRYIL